MTAPPRSQRMLFDEPNAQRVAGCPPFRGHPLARREQILGVTSETADELLVDRSSLLGVIYVWRPVPQCEGWWENVERRYTRSVGADTGGAL